MPKWKGLSGLLVFLSHWLRRVTSSSGPLRPLPLKELVGANTKPNGSRERKERKKSTPTPVTLPCYFTFQLKGSCHKQPLLICINRLNQLMQKSFESIAYSSAENHFIWCSKKPLANANRKFTEVNTSRHMAVDKCGTTTMPRYVDWDEVSGFWRQLIKTVWPSITIPLVE